MRLTILLAAAALSVAATPAFAQGAPDPGADMAKSKEIDEAYLGRCQSAAPKELCSCVVSVANAQINGVAERQVFFDFMMGDVDKAKTARTMFSPQRNMEFNVSLQKADSMLGENCDRLKPQPAQQPKQPAAQP